MLKRIAILGSTGSIGTQALEVIGAYPEQFQVEVLTAGRNVELLIEQALRFQPNAVVIFDESKYQQAKQALEHTFIKVFAGEQALQQVVEFENVDMVLTAMVGFAGLQPTINAIKAGKHIALANKETLVVAGDLITRLAIEHRVMLLPVDSEHSAIFQCLVGENLQSVEKIILTASGGPFRGKTREYLSTVKSANALKHPTWNMGKKITIDSASLMNKGLEVIEAKWLFNLKPEQIEVIIHPQSVIHSMVQFSDGSIKAQMGLPNMKLPIHYALSFPSRLKSQYQRFSFTDYPNLSFEKVDKETFRNLQIAYKAMEIGGNAACVMNAANEIAVEKFLKDEITFLSISDIIEYAMLKVAFINKPSYNDLLESDREARNYANNFKI